MSHKRYRNPRNGYSRSQARDHLAIVLDEELEFEDQLSHADFDATSVAALMRDGPPPTAAAADADGPEPSAATPPSSAATVVHRGVASMPVERQPNAAIRALERVLAALRRARR